MAAPQFRISDEDLYLFHEGRHLRLYDKLGTHVGQVDGVAGCHCAVWAPNAEAVSLICDRNGWQPDRTPLRRLGSGADATHGSGVWYAFVPGMAEEVTARLQPWQAFAERAVAKALPDGPLARIAPVSDLAHAVVAGILGLELLAHTSGDRDTPVRVLDQAAGGIALLDLLTRPRRAPS